MGGVVNAEKGRLKIAGEKIASGKRGERARLINLEANHTGLARGSG